MIKAVLFLFIFSPCVFASSTIKFVFTFEGQTFEKIIDNFTAQENINIERVWSEQGDLKVNLLEYIEKGNAPDIVLLPADHVGLYQLMNYSVIPIELQSTAISTRIWNNVRSDGEIYGIPIIQGNHLVLYYNKKYVKNVAHSWDEIEQQKLAFQEDKSRQESAKFIAWNFEEMYWLSAFFAGFGGQHITNGQLTLDSNAMVNALDAYKNLNEKNIPEKNCHYVCAHTLFTQGKLAYTINGDWAFKEYHSILGDDLGIAQLPVIDEQTPLVSLFSTHVLAFPNNSLNSSKQQALKKFIHYILQENTQEKIWQLMQVFPVHQKVFESIKQSDSMLVSELYQALTNAQPMSSDSDMSYAWSGMRKGFLRHQAGILDAEKSAKLMQKIATSNKNKHNSK